MSLLSAQPVLLLFGLSGCGKSHIGALISELTGRYFYDADADVTPAMAAALAAQQPFTDAMRDEFFARMADRILALQQVHGELVVAQAVYKQQHRDYLLARLPSLELVLVEANDELISQRIQARGEGISLASAAALRADFEVPGPETRRIRNDGDDAHLVDQLNRLFG